MSLENGDDNVADLTSADIEANLVADFAQEFGDDLDSDEEQPEKAKPRKAAQSEPEAEDEADDLELSDEDEAEGDEVEDEDTDDDEEVEKPTTVKLKTGDEVTLDELESGYLRQKDFTKKTQELAEVRTQFSEASKAVVAAEREAKEALDLVTQVMQALIPSAPSIEALRENPQQYMLQKAEYDAQVQLLNELVAKAKSVGQGSRTAQETEYNQFLRNERQALAEKVPEFKSQKAFNSWVEKAADDAAEYWGADPETIKRIPDHVSYLVLKDALAYRKAVSAAKGKQAAQGQASRTQPARQQARVLRPGAMNQAPRSNQGQDVSRKHLNAALSKANQGDDRALAALLGSALSKGN